MSISIVICTYNRANLLELILQDLQNQNITLSEVEIMVVDNNSQDHTYDVVKQYKEKIPLKYIFEPQQGLSFARNRGWQESQSEYVAYLDDDARVPETWLSAALEIISIEKPHIFGGPYFSFYVEEKPKWVKSSYFSFYPFQVPKWLGSGEFLAGGNIVMKKSLLENVEGFETNFGMKGLSVAYGEETELLMRVYQQQPKYKVYYHPELYIKHLTRADKLKWVWLIKSSFAQGRDYKRLLIHYEKYTDVTYKKILKDGLHLVLNLTRGLAYSIFKRDKERYPHVQNYLFEVTLSQISQIGQLVTDFHYCIRSNES